jgi:hypothetical protein
MELNPQKSLTDLEAAYCTYMSSAPEQRGELAVKLNHAIRRGEVEAGNLARDVSGDFEKNVLYKKLMCMVEMADVTLKDTSVLQR